VISFDLPSHGENSGSYNDLNKFTFENLAKLAARVENITQPRDLNRPLLLAGWSTGGLIVVRALQENWTSAFSRPIAGVILFAPGIAVRKFPWTFGNKKGVVTQATLTHNPQPPHRGPIRPDTPFWSSLAFRFAPELLMNSIESQRRPYPTEIKTLIFSGGDKEDVYAKSPVLREWAETQNSLRQSRNAEPILSVQCPHSAHEMDNEPSNYGGQDVRTAAAVFAADVAKFHQQPQNFNLSACVLLTSPR
jgi:pimeloyl-ACP methyl ester carboxylesterase